MKTFKSTIVALSLTSSLCFAHGEDKPGPNGGSIRMPGNFHTEVVSLGKNKIKVFLLDVSFANPTVIESSVNVTFQTRKTFKSQCEKNENAFVCTFDSAVDLNSKGKLLINATRDKQTGNVAEYATPLKF